MQTLSTRLGGLGLLVRPLLLILVPTLLCCAYWAFVYTPKFEVTIIAVPRSGERPMTNDAAGAMLGSALQSKDIDSRMLEHYLQSADLLAKLDADLDLRGHYASPRIHFLQRLGADAGTDDLLSHYRRHLRIIVDSSSLIHLQVRAYDPDFVLRLADHITAHCETFLNEVSVTLAEKQVEFIRSEVAKAETQLALATRHLTEHQSKAGLLDPTRYSSDLMEVIAKLEAEMTRAQATLSGKLTLYSPDTPQIEAERVRIQAIGDEIARLRKRLTSIGATGEKTGMAADILAFNDVLIESEFATKTYAAALLALQAAHAEAAYNVRTLIVLSRPSSIEAVTYPRVGYWTLTTLALLTLLFVLFKLIIDSVDAHVDR